MSLFPEEDVLTKEIETWRAFIDKLLSDDNRVLSSLRRILINVLQDTFPDGVKITANQPYLAWISTENKQKLKWFVVPAAAGYIATVIGVLMLNWETISTDIVTEAFLASLFPAGAAFALKIYEQYK